MNFLCRRGFFARKCQGGSVIYRQEFRRLRAASDFARGGKVTKTPPGTAPEEHRSGAPSRLTPDPVTGVTPWSSHKISGAQNLSECLNPRRATGPWVCEKLGPARFHNCAWVCRTNGTEPFSAVGAALAAARGPVWDRPLPIIPERSRPFVGAGPRPARKPSPLGRLPLSGGNVPKGQKGSGGPKGPDEDNYLIRPPGGRPKGLPYPKWESILDFRRGGACPSRKAFPFRGRWLAEGQTDEGNGPSYKGGSFEP